MAGASSSIGQFTKPETHTSIKTPVSSLSIHQARLESKITGFHPAEPFLSTPRQIEKQAVDKWLSISFMEVTIYKIDFAK
ncbi:unnamed protein product [Dovyalis caffra]|uniref:Uncharacterized protein n=1 Tax=Dovyalis caffra TaxID=77055 RepID=A0AAV1STJ4_9ROSI|nr:unnamed protein product [Dovyalis caffra]